MAYSRYRVTGSYYDWPDTRAPVEADFFEQIDAAVYDLKTQRAIVRLDDIAHVGGSPTPLGNPEADSLSYFNTALAYAATVFSGGAQIVVPAGQWYISGPIVLPDGFSLVGEAPSSARIRAMSTFSGTAMIKNSTNSQEYVWCEDLYVDGRGYAAIGILYDTVFVNSGIRRCVCTNHTTNGIKITTTVISGGSGPVSLEDVWAVSSGQHAILLSGTVQVWAHRVTAEHPGATYSAIQITGNGTAQGILFDGVHVETSQSTCNGLVIDGAMNVHVRNLSAGGSTLFTDVVKITNASGTPKNVTVDGVYVSSTTPNGIHDVVNGVTLTGKNTYPRYVMPEAAATRSTLTVGASPYTFQNLDGRPVKLAITGGTVSAVAYSRDNSTFDTIAAATGTSVDVAPGDYVKVTYTVLPTIAKYLTTW